MWKALVLIAVILIGFGVPILSGTSLPKNLDAHELGKFIGSILKYWIDVLKYALEKASLSCNG